MQGAHCLLRAAFPPEAEELVVAELLERVAFVAVLLRGHPEEHREEGGESNLRVEG